ncbi:YbhB/YbcL family Raf kinase inhibitor-like protein [Sorangium sp. So ce204]|uniref:YbhB/YbcL family Raf kinase inhibitor-like protein n=1 Tax=Sorangium sp. So ce204 TaxID=3133288 RepID=UPI003F62DE45
MRTITDRLTRSARYLAFAALPFAILNCSSGDPDESGNGGSTAASTSSQSASNSNSSSSADSSSSSSSGGDPTTTTTSGVGGSGEGGATGVGGSGEGGSGGSGGAPSEEFALASTNHEEGAKFADKYTCQTAGFQNSVMPELHWTPGPAGTKSYAITFIDVTLAHATPSQPNGYHWVLYNIPATTTSLPEGFKQADATQLRAMQNSNYLGPCPNFGSSSGTKTDTYEFTIYALAEESITITGTGTAAVRDAETKLEAKNLGSAKLTGTSNAFSTR